MSADGGRRLVLRPVRVAVAAVLALVVVGILLIVLIGPSDDEQIEQLTTEYGQAEAADACQYLSSEALATLEQQGGCEFAFRGVPEVALEIQSLEVQGDTAAAQVQNPKSPQPFELTYVEEDGDWKVQTFPGLEQPIVPPDQPTPTLPEETETEDEEPGETDTTEEPTTTEAETAP